MNNQPTYPTFRLGIILAGAVSAGAYTAGVMDYLLDCLYEWDQLKTENKKILNSVNGNWSEAKKASGFRADIPMHDVIIEILAGASAGGMTTGIVLSTLLDKEKTQSENKESLLYNAWVNLNEEQEGDVFKQMLDTKDLSFLSRTELKKYWEENNKPSKDLQDERELRQLKGGVQSLFNSKFIKDIADKTLPKEMPQDWYNYISNDLRLMLTICSLRGVPIKIHFDTNTDPQSNGSVSEVAHKMFVHKGVAHFRFAFTFNDKNPKENPEPECILIETLNKDDQTYLKDSSIATGAFPFAFKSMLLHIEEDKLKAQLEKRLGIEKNQIDLPANKHFFSFRSIDGGTINNEPIAEVEDFLKDQEKDKNNYGVIMVDPFPNFEEVSKPETAYLPTLPNLIPRVIDTIRHQAMVKEKSTVSSFNKMSLSDWHVFLDRFRRTLKTHSLNNRSIEKKDKIRGLIFPHISGIDNVLACGGLGGFMGFFSKKFRDHDYNLGKFNCEGFLTKYYGLPMDKDYGLYQSKKDYRIKTDEDWQQYLKNNKIRKKDNPNKETKFYRIIPTLSTLKPSLFNQTEPFVDMVQKDVDTERTLEKNRRKNRLSALVTDLNKKVLEKKYLRYLRKRFRQILRIQLHAFFLPKVIFTENGKPVKYPSGMQNVEIRFTFDKYGWLRGFFKYSLMGPAALLFFGILIYLCRSCFLLYFICTFLFLTIAMCYSLIYWFFPQKMAKWFLQKVEDGINFTNPIKE